MDLEQMQAIPATVFNIQKFCTDDGPGIRTTVFLKGCPLRCQWCHNPEGLSRAPILEYNDRLCAFCRRCAAVCPMGCHTFSDTAHHVDRSACVHCGKCVQVCRYGAIRFCGQRMTAGEVLKIVMADRAFYAASGGGVTISGGEPLLQPDFTETLLRLAKQQGLHTCIETSGAVSFDIFERIRPYVDLFLFDVKETDTENHFRYTGVSNQLLLENLRKLDALGSAIQLRCPIIPGVNDLPRHFEQLKQLYASLVHAVGIQLMPYHALGQGKTSRFGVEDAHRFPVPTAEQINTWNQLIHSETTIKG